MDKMTGDDEMLVDIDLDLPTSVAAASGWIPSDADDDVKPAKAGKADAAGVDPLPSKELEDARRAAQEAQTRLDAITKQAETDRAERVKAQDEAAKNQTYALNSHLARMDAELKRVQSDHDQLATSLGAWKSHVEMAKRQLAQAIDVGDSKAQAEMNAQIAEGHAMLTQLEAGRAGAQRDIELAKRDRETAIRAAQAASEKAQTDADKRAQVKEQEAAPTPDDFITTVRGKIGDHAAEWFKSHRDFITDERLHKRMQNFVEDWVDRNGESAIRTSKFTEALDDRFGFAQKKAAPAAEPADEEEDMEDEKPARAPAAPAAPVSRGNSVGKAPGTSGSKVRLSSDEAATAALMYPDLQPADARKKYATNKARLIADGRL
jgi:hypothetical protein